jgi:hypothetical protein
MHDLAFADAARPTRVACLRLQLLDYSIGHEILLLQQRNPLLCLARDDFDTLPLAEQILAVKSAALICCQTWRQNQTRHRWLRLWGWLTRKSNYALAIAEFRNYLDEAHRLLPIPGREEDEIANGERDDHGRESGAPFLAQLLNYISAFQHFSISAFDFPYPLASALYLAHLESEGRIRIANRKETEIAMEMNEHRAAVAAEEAAESHESAIRNPQSAMP